MQQYLWIGVGSSDAEREKILKNGGKLLSAEVSNDALMQGLEACGVALDSINSTRLPTYPHYPLRKIERSSWSYASGKQGVNVAYLNYPYLNLLSKRRSMQREAKRWATEHRGQDVTVFVYQMHTPFMAAARTVKRIIPDARIVLIVPDLPQYMDVKKSLLKRILKRIDWCSIKRCMRSVDKYVLYSRHMADFLGLKDGAWTVMEGSYDASLTVREADVHRSSENISVMYSGRLDLCYGVKELLDAMQLLDGRFELWLTGDGNAVPLIKERAEADPRIQYYGFLPSRYELLKKQCEATMLISTRDPLEPASAYCFPSKIFEYMVSGNPVISTRIKGIPEEYFEHLIPLDSITPEEIARAISLVAEMPKEARQSFGGEARDFVLNKKNNVSQAQKILDFV